MIIVLIGDDHRIVREGLKQVLADAPDMCVLAEAQTGPEVLERVQVLVLHGVVPIGTNCGVCRRRASSWPDPCIGNSIQLQKVTP